MLHTTTATTSVVRSKYGRTKQRRRERPYLLLNGIQLKENLLLHYSTIKLCILIKNITMHYVVIGAC